MPFVEIYSITSNLQFNVLKMIKANAAIYLCIDSGDKNVGKMYMYKLQGPHSLK